MSVQNLSSTGYGPSRYLRLYFDGDERKFEQWLVKFMAYMKLKGLKDVIDPPSNPIPTPAPAATTGGGTTGGGDSDNDTTAAAAATGSGVTTPPTPAPVVDDAEKNSLAYSELVQFIDDRSLSLVMRDAKDDGRKAIQILKEHYQGSGKPRILSLYTELMSLCKQPTELLTDYVLRAEKHAAALEAAGHSVDDSLLVAMVLKGLPNQYKPFEVVITQHEKEDISFHEFKVRLRSYEETEKARGSGSRKENVMSLQTIICYKCRQPGHKAPQCPSNQTKPPGGGKSSKSKSSKRWCTICSKNNHDTKFCRNNPDKNKRDQASCADDSDHFFVMAVSECDKEEVENDDDSCCCGNECSCETKEVFSPTVDKSVENSDDEFCCCDDECFCDDKFDLDEPYVVELPPCSETLPAQTNVDDDGIHDEMLSTSVEVEPRVDEQLSEPTDVVESEPCVEPSIDEPIEENNGGEDNDLVMMNDETDSCVSNGEMTPPFLVDSGCSCHIVNDDEHFVEINEDFQPTDHAVKLADGTVSVGQAVKKGT